MDNILEKITPGKYARKALQIFLVSLAAIIITAIYIRLLFFIFTNSTESFFGLFSLFYSIGYMLVWIFMISGFVSLLAFIYFRIRRM